ncbi:MAG: hypothetical protein KF844_00535 [Cryobacterium sp.]|nr:hypothetical protein [Cryobacterium sp.]
MSDNNSNLGAGEPTDDGLDAWFNANFGAANPSPAAPEEERKPEPVLPPEPRPEPTPEINPEPRFEPATPSEPASPATGRHSIISDPAPVFPGFETPLGTTPVIPGFETPLGVPTGTQTGTPSGAPTPIPADTPFTSSQIPPQFTQQSPTESEPPLPVPPETQSAPTSSTQAVLGGGGIDDLFGESNFQDYEAEPLIGRLPSGPREKAVRLKPGPAGIGKTQKVLMWIAGGLVAALALVVLFYFGTKLPAMLGPAPVKVALPTATPNPTPTVKPIGPVAPGEYRWDELLGGECIDPYNGPWVDKYTVVDCAQPHAAQLTTVGEFGNNGNPLDPFPGLTALQSQIGILCTSSAVIDYAAAAAYSDIQFEASYPVDAAQWVKGDHNYYCFVSRSSEGALTGSIAVPEVPETPTPAP